METTHQDDSVSGGETGKHQKVKCHAHDVDEETQSEEGQGAEEVQGTEKPVANYLGQQEIEDRPRVFVLRAIKVCGETIQRAYTALNARDFHGEPNQGITELAFKVTWVATLTALFPEIQVSTERTVRGGRLDLLLFYKGYVEVMELKYVRIGFLSFVKYTENPTVMAGQLRSGKERLLRIKSDPLALQYRVKFTNRRTRTIQEDADFARKQAKNYVDALVLGDIDPLPKWKNYTVGYTVICGVGPLVLQTAQSLVFPNTRNRPSLS